MPAGRAHGRHADRLRLFGEVGRGSDPVPEVILVQHLLESDRDRVHVVARQPAVGREPLRQNQKVSRLASHLRIVQRQEPADVGHSILLGRHRAAVHQREHLADNLTRRPVGLPGLPQLDEPGVFGEATGVEIERDVVLVADLPDAAEVFERDRLPAAAVVRDRHHHQRNALDPLLADRRLERLQVHVPLEGVLGRRHPPLGNDQVPRLRADVFNVRASGVEVGVVGDDLALARP